MTEPSLTLGPADLAPRARIREAALRLYAERGLRATSIRMVAEEAGLSAGAVMHHFKTKDELAEAVAAAADAVRARMRTAELERLVTFSQALASTLERLAARFGNRLITSQAVREQHGHTTTWLTNQPPDLLPGTLDLLILRTLVAGPLHGYGIAERLLEAAERKLWDAPDPQTLAALREVYLETEGDLEG